MIRFLLPRAVLCGVVACAAIGLVGCEQPDSVSSTATTPAPPADQGARRPGDGTAYVPTYPAGEGDVGSSDVASAGGSRGEASAAEASDDGSGFDAALREPETDAPPPAPHEQDLPQAGFEPPAAEAEPEDLTVPQEALLVDAAGLQRLDEEYNVWTDPDGKRVVLAALVVRREGPLEMFACLKGTKEHESIVAVHAKAFLIHAALLAVGATAGSPVRFVDDRGDQKFQPAHGDEIEVTVLWKDQQGEVRQARGQDWVRNIKTGAALDAPWVFGGSSFWVNEATGERFYTAEDGDVICVSNFTTAMIDLPLESSQAAAELMFEPFTERVPERGTLVTLLLTPRPGSRPGPVSLEAPLPKREDIDAEPDATPAPSGTGAPVADPAADSSLPQREDLSRERADGETAPNDSIRLGP